MKCSVWRSSHKEQTFLYLAEKQVFEELPTDLLKVFGTPEFVLDLELSTERKLASEDVNVVMRNLSDQGFHLQLPIQLSVEEIIQRSL